MAWGLLSSVTSDPKNFMGLSSMDIIGTGSSVGLARLNTIFVVFPLLIDSERHLDAFRTNPIDFSFITDKFLMFGAVFLDDIEVICKRSCVNRFHTC